LSWRGGSPVRVSLSTNRRKNVRERLVLFIPSVL
jgi:hypothetical protein